LVIKRQRRRRRGLPLLLFRLCAQNRSPRREKKTKKKKTVGTDWNSTTKTLRRKRRQTNDTTRSSGRKNCTATSNVSKLENTHVVIIGIGGIGSWCAEALARTSIGEFTLIDLDFICVTNINRQTMAMESTVGESKALAMKKRILDLNKDAKVNCVEDFVNKENVEEILKPLVGCGEGRKVEYVVDCTDNEQDKAAIIAYCVKHNVPVLTTGGAAGMTNFPPSGVAVEDLQKATFNRLLASARKTLRDKYAFPRGVKKFPNGKRMKSDDVVAGDGKKTETFKERKFKVIAVYAKELSENFAVKNSNTSSSDSDGGVPSGGKINCTDGSSGSAAFVTGAIGLAAASKVVVDVLARTDAQREKIGQPFKSGWQSKVWTSSDRGGGEDAHAEKADESTENKTDKAKTIPTPMGNKYKWTTNRLRSLLARTSFTMPRKITST